MRLRPLIRQPRWRGEGGGGKWRRSEVRAGRGSAGLRLLLSRRRGGRQRGGYRSWAGRASRGSPSRELNELACYLAAGKRGGVLEIAAPRSAAGGARRGSAPPARDSAPRLRPVFLWARQDAIAGTLTEVRCEDYDARNRLRLARTERGWRAVPRTPRYDRLKVDRPTVSVACDLETHIPSHTITQPVAPVSPSPLDSLLAVAELELSQHRLELQHYLPDDFSMSEPAADLFAALDPAGLLPADHDDDLLESLVERGCEDNLVLLDPAHPTPPATSPGRSSMTAAQGLLHLHMFSDSAPPAAHDTRPGNDLPYGSDAIEIQANGDAAKSDIHMAEQVYDNVHITAVVSDNNIAGQTYDNINEHTYENIHMSGVASDNNHVEQPYVHITAVAPENNITEQTYENVHMTGISSENNITELDYVHMSAVVSENNIVEQQYENVHITQIAPEHNIPAPVYDEISEASPREVTISETANKRREFVPEEEEHGESCNSENSRVETDNEYGKVATPTIEEMIPTDLSMKRAEVTISTIVRMETIDAAEDAMSDRSDEQPRDLSIRRPHPNTPQVSPRRPEPARAPSRESDAMQSPQPSGIPAVPSSPELFIAPVPQPPPQPQPQTQTKSNKTLFLERLLSSPSPKMYTSEVTISMRECEPLNLGKHRKSASPTVSSCSEEIKKTTEESDEPDEKKIKADEDIKPDVKTKRRGRTEDLAVLKAWRNFRVECNLPDPLLVPKDKLNDIIASPIAELSTLLLRRPELRLPDVFSYPAVLQDPDILVVSLAQLDNILETRARVPDTTQVTPHSAPHAPRDTKMKSEQRAADRDSALRQRAASFSSGADLAGDIDAATAAAFNQMVWLPYLSHLEQTYGRTQAELAKVAAAAGAPSPVPPSRSPVAPYPPRQHESSRPADLQHPYVHSTRPPFYPYPGNHQRAPPAAPSYYPKYRSAAPEPPRPRISVKSLHNLLEPAGVSGGSAGASRRRREDPEVGSTTPLGELPQAQVYSHHGLQSLHTQHAQLAAQHAQHALHGQHAQLNHNQHQQQLWHPLYGK